MADNVEAIGNRASVGARRLSFGRLRAIDDFESPASNHRDENQRYIRLDHITGALVEISVESYKSRLIIGRRGDDQ